MDLWNALKELNEERERLDKVIATLEALKSGNDLPAKSRRGRKSMPAGERRLVSERMKRYWEARRKMLRRE